MNPTRENERMAHAASGGKKFRHQGTVFVPLRKPTIHLAKRITLVSVGVVLMAFNINIFIHAGGLVQGSFTGLSLLILQIFDHFLYIWVTIQCGTLSVKRGTGCRLF
jgi:hypothetical protein